MKDILAILTYTLLGIAAGLYLLLSSSNDDPNTSVHIEASTPEATPTAHSEMPSEGLLGTRRVSPQGNPVAVPRDASPVEAVPAEPVTSRPLEIRSERSSSRSPTAQRAPPRLARGSYRERASYFFPAGTSTSEFYPAEAVGAGVGGVATVHCTVRASGTIHSCATAQEVPAGYGFGRAAARLVLSNVHATPERVNGTPTNAGTITVSIRFEPN
jgi:TonB family protein